MSESLRLAEFFARISSAFSDPDGSVALDEVAQRALEVVRVADHCSISVRRRASGGEPAGMDTVASTSDVATHCDALQAELQEGPCWEAAFDLQDAVVSDVLAERRWPKWCAAAADLGVRSVYAVGLRDDDGVRASINFLAAQPRALDDPDDRALADVFASHLGNAMHNSRQVAGLRTAMGSRHAIGMAQGVIATRYDLSYEQAFDVLHRLSNETNTRLREVAHQVLSLRGLPGS